MKKGRLNIAVPSLIFDTETGSEVDLNTPVMMTEIMSSVIYSVR